MHKVPGLISLAPSLGVQVSNLSLGGCQPSPDACSAQGSSDTKMATAWFWPCWDTTGGLLWERSICSLPLERQQLVAVGLCLSRCRAEETLVGLPSSREGSGYGSRSCRSPCPITGPILPSPDPAPPPPGPMSLAGAPTSAGPGWAVLARWVP